MTSGCCDDKCKVSTHSRPKAAAKTRGGLTALANMFQLTAARRRLLICAVWGLRNLPFQLTAARRRLQILAVLKSNIQTVSTHSRPKAAALKESEIVNFLIDVSTHSRPKAAATDDEFHPLTDVVSTHSRPKAAAVAADADEGFPWVSTHSRPKAAAYLQNASRVSTQVSTHSRPKAAAFD